MAKLFNYIGLRDLVPSKVKSPDPKSRYMTSCHLTPSGLHQSPTSGPRSNFNTSESSPADSTGLHQTYIGYVCCTFLESGQSSPADSTGLHRTPTYLDYSQNLISRVFSPADSSGLTGPPSLDNTQFYIPVDSGGLRRTPAVPTCDDM